MNAYTPKANPEEYDIQLIRALVDHLNSPSIALGPLLMTLSMILTLVLEMDGGAMNLVLAPITVSLGLIGGYLYFHSILVFMRTRDLILERKPNTVKYIGVAVLYTATYYLLIGSFLAKKFIADVWKDTSRRQVEYHQCNTPRPFVVLASLGAIVGFFARCVASELALLFNSFISDHIVAHEGSKGLGSEANQWK